MRLKDSGTKNPFRLTVASLLRNLGVRKEVGEKKGQGQGRLVYCEVKK